MMTQAKKSRKSKKSTTKKRIFSISPLIPVIAMIEVVILVIVSSYAWYYVQASKVIGSGTISAAADSGLDIDFQYSNVDDYINIWNYVGNDFTFEPATSLDGRTIYFPTSGTFNNDKTADTVFRDGTVNDINSKYLSIDFELTNTSDYDQYVYLNNKSYFHVKEKNSDAYEESRALRLAFYQNDGNSGNVGSSLLTSESSSDGGVIETPVSADAYTIYYDNSSTNWGAPYAYFWDYDDGSNPTYHTAWPGVKMDRVSGSIYSVTIENPTTTNGVKYDKLIFSNNGSSQQATRDLTASSKGHKFNASGDQGAYSERTIYFAKPYQWGSTVKCYAWNTSSNSPYTPGNGDDMTYVGSGIYAYSYDSSQTGGVLFNNGSMQGENQTVNIGIDASSNGKVYYTMSNGSDYKDSYNKYQVTYADYSSLTYRTIYLFNTYGWEKPYATVSYGSGTSVTTCDIAMTSLSGNVYYCTVPSTIYTQVYFRAKNQANDTDRTEQVPIVDYQVYRPKVIGDSDATVEDSGHTYWALKTFMYDKYIKTSGYPVISPGVSAGFQRPYSPVITIDAYSGAATEVVPAYSNSIDNYILGSGTELFILESGHMASLSMIMWLEGTDDACTGAAYASRQIDLRLEFSTEYYPDGMDHDPVIVNPGDSNSYIYNFYDKTREIWTSDRQPTESGVTIAPVMQLYDNTAKRGYKMSPANYASYNGKQKVSCWTVTAPQSIARNGHDIIFRRVNPYNEDEVWNYWHAGPVAGDGSTVVEDNSLNVYSIALSGGNTVSFTAFADGSPLSSMAGLSSDTDEDYCVPTDSCGGLWGNHAVRTVTVYDGLPGQPLKDNNGVLTINYSYPYITGETTQRTVKIEYKASGPEYNSFYFFIVPEVAYANNVSCAVKRYTGFNSEYAINSEENNPDITFVDYYGKGQSVSGDYFELNQLTDTEHTDYSYWGSDLLYVQTNYYTKNYCYTSSSSSDSNAKLIQVRFTADNFAVESNDRFVFLYYNGNFSPTDGSGGSGFVCVVPNDKTFTKYRIENCSYNGDYKYNVTNGITVSGSSDVTFTDSFTGESYDMKVRYLDQNGLTLTSISAEIFLQTTYQDYNQRPHLHSFSTDNGADFGGWPGALMTWDSDVDSMRKYKCTVDASKYNKIIFNYWSNSSQQSPEITLDLNNIHNGDVYETKNKLSPDKVVTGTDNATLRYASWAVIDWPHLTFQS